MATPTHIAPADRIPFLQKIMFAAGGSTELLATTLLMYTLWMPYFNIGLGLSPVLLGVVLMVFQLWNGFMDPVMGNISDNTRTRWGRRRPFLAVGALLTGTLYPLFWYMPAGMGNAAKSVYLVIVGCVFFTCFSSWAMAYYGLQLELTPNYDERTRLTGWMSVFQRLASLSGGWVLAIVTGSMFINSATGKGDIVLGMKTACWFIAGGIILFGLLPAIFVKERYYEAESSRQPRERFWQSIKESSGCMPLWSLIGISFPLTLGYAAVSALSLYVNIYYVFNGDIHAASIVNGWKATATTVAGILLIPFWAWLSERFDKRKAVLCTVSLAIIGHLLYYFCLRPDMPYLQLIPSLFESCAFSAIWLFIPSMKADVADYDELHTTRRREGSINSFCSWFLKVSMTCAVGLGGLVLQLSGFTSKIIHQPPAVLHRMVTLYILFPIGFWIIALLIAYFYPLSRRRMGEIRAELEIRRGAI